MRAESGIADVSGQPLEKFVLPAPVHMAKLSVSTRAAILRCLIEGNSIRSTCRITGAAKDTVTKLLVDAGEACAAYQFKHLRNLPSRVLQLDEVWSFVGCREKSKATAVNQHPGDVWL